MRRKEGTAIGGENRRRRKPKGTCKGSNRGRRKRKIKEAGGATEVRRVGRTQRRSKGGGPQGGRTGKPQPAKPGRFFGFDLYKNVLFIFAMGTFFPRGTSPIFAKWFPTPARYPPLHSGLANCKDRAWDFRGGRVDLCQIAKIMWTSLQ